MENQFKGKCLGKLSDLYGHDCRIEIDEVDCWFNQSNNILLIINGKPEINCSRKLSDKIRQRNLDQNTDKLKNYLIYEFEDCGRYLTHMEGFVSWNEFFNKKDVEETETEIKNTQVVGNERKDLIIAKQKKKDKTTSLILSEEKINILVNDLIQDVENSGERILFSKDELLNAIWNLPNSENSSYYIKRGYYLGKQAFLFRNPAKIHFSIFGIRRLALVGIIGDICTTND